MAATPMITEKIALLALLYQQEPRPDRSVIRARLADGASASSILDDTDDALLPVDASAARTAAATELRGWEEVGIRVLTPVDAEYPAQLFGVHDYPLALFTRGRVLDDFRSAAIVGSREFSEGARVFVRDLAVRLVEASVTVVSGLARGVDGTAHRAALNAGGRTVAVLGNGLNHVYPAEHRGMQAEIAESGLLVSQFRPETRSSRQTFPQRNVTMSAYSSVTVIAEAQENSGTRIQARAAIAHGRPLVLSDQVVRTTTWGREYADGPYDVHVAPDSETAARTVLGILARANQPFALAAG